LGDTKYDDVRVTDKDISSPIQMSKREEKIVNTRLAVVSLWAEDVPTTAHFYRDVIGLTLLAHHGKQPHLDLDGCYLTILKGCPVPAQNADPARFPIIAFAVSNLDTAVERLRTHDVEMPWGVEQDGLSRWVMFHDPAGNLIEFVQY
jgi:catechol 2,3-dioxygenase-like lactoylglutathione lyase family enzyme